LAVSYTRGADTTYFPVVVLGPGFYTPLGMDNWFDHYQNKRGWEKYKKDGLVHEFLHIALRMDDKALAAELDLNKKGYPWKDAGSASVAIQLFLLNDCKDNNSKKKKRQ
jgi:hypothetical protein